MEGILLNLGDYVPVLVFAVIAAGLSLGLVALAFLRSRSAPTVEKESAYECGFYAFQDARVPFNVRFYIIAILFIIFDLEIAFLFPWAICFRQLGWIGFASMMAFLSILAVGFIYEWRKGALEWE